MKTKIEEIIPQVLKRLSRGESMSTTDILNQYGGTRSSFNERFKHVRETFFSRYISYDKQSDKWIAKAKFLEKILITPEEAVVLAGIMRKKNEFGAVLSHHVESVIEKYLKRLKSSVYKQNVLEKVDAGMEKKFAQIKYAIENSKQLSFMYKKNKEKYTLIPYKVINLEYYWYLLGYEVENGNGYESNLVKTYAIKYIQNLDISEGEGTYDFSHTEKRLVHAMNAFFSVNEEVKTIEVLIVDWFVPYIERAQYFSGWKATGIIEVRDKKNYHVYELISTHDKYLDIIPTILRYIPNILIREDQDITKEIFNHLESFANLHCKKII